jgi:voltage-gated potassium channel
VKKINKYSDSKSISYDLFILAISILAILNIIIILLTGDLNMDQVLVIANFTLSLFLMVDFVYRVSVAENKIDYLVSGLGWLDFLGSLPLFWMPIFRIFRIIRMIRIFRNFGLSNIREEIHTEPASSVLAGISFLVILVLQFGSYLMIGIESKASNPNITHPLDSLWWAIVTITTVGYGDRYPVTDLGRIIGALVILLGVILFSVLTSYFTNKFSTRVKEVDLENSADLKNDISELQRMLEYQQTALAEIERQLARIEKQLEQNTG